MNGDAQKVHDSIGQQHNLVFECNGPMTYALRILRNNENMGYLINYKLNEASNPCRTLSEMKRAEYVNKNKKECMEKVGDLPSDSIFESRSVIQSRCNETNLLVYIKPMTLSGFVRHMINLKS